MDTKKRGSHETRNGLYVDGCKNGRDRIYTLDTLNCVVGMSDRMTTEELARYFIEPFKSYMPESDIKDEELEMHIDELKENIEAHASEKLDRVKEIIKNEMYIEDAEEKQEIWTNYIIEGVIELIEDID